MKIESLKIHGRIRMQCGAGAAWSRRNAEQAQCEEGNVRQSRGQLSPCADSNTQDHLGAIAKMRLKEARAFLSVGCHSYHS